jgi:hypothetical protein
MKVFLIGICFSVLDRNGQIVWKGESVPKRKKKKILWRRRELTGEKGERLNPSCGGERMSKKRTWSSLWVGARRRAIVREGVAGREEEFD